MKFTFELEENYLNDPKDFRFEVKEAVINTCVEEIMRRECTDGYNRTAYGNVIEEILKQNKHEIIDGVIKKVADDISRKKEIVSLVPKTSEINQINRENQKYFEELIDKAVAKKFK